MDKTVAATALESRANVRADTWVLLKDGVEELIRSLGLFEFSVTFSKIQEEELFILVVCFCFCNRRSADGSLVRSPVRLCPSDHERCKATELPLLLHV